MTISSIKRVLCLAMTVLGPLTVEAPTLEFSDSHESPSSTSFQSLLGRSLSSIFSSVEWSTLKRMTSVFGSTWKSLRNLSQVLAIPSDDIPKLDAGARLLKKWEVETGQMMKDIQKLRNELATTQAKCAELAQENDGLRHKCEAYSEAGIILEQDRQQLQSLLSDKCKLLEENQQLEREISSLQELLDYATEHAAEKDGFEGILGVDYVEDDDLASEICFFPQSFSSADMTDDNEIGC